MSMQYWRNIPLLLFVIPLWCFYRTRKWFVILRERRLTIDNGGKLRKLFLKKLSFFFFELYVEW